MDAFPNIHTKTYEQLRSEIRSGDILLCSGTAIFSNMIQQATNSVWSHVAFVLRVDAIDRIMLLESVESIGVRAVTLSSYINDYNGSGKAYPGKLMLARHHDMKQENIKNLSKHAVDLLGHPYNMQEVINIAARVSMDMIGLNSGKDKVTQQEFICSEYAYECFQSVGVNIDFNPLGFIAPADFARCKKVSPLAYIATEQIKTTTTLTEFA
jgi:hypothetical protein